VRVTRLGQRFAGHRGIVDTRAERLDHAAVRGHIVAFPEQDHVARH
jgi:hypothetical protein